MNKEAGICTYIHILTLTSANHLFEIALYKCFRTPTLGDLCVFLDLRTTSNDSLVQAIYLLLIRDQRPNQNKNHPQALAMPTSVLYV